MNPEGEASKFVLAVRANPCLPQATMPTTNRHLLLSHEGRSLARFTTPVFQY